MIDCSRLCVRRVSADSCVVPSRREHTDQDESHILHSVRRRARSVLYRACQRQTTRDQRTCTYNTCSIAKDTRERSLY